MLEGANNRRAGTLRGNRREQNARRREFLYAIAHELRSPLTSIQAFAELLTSDRSLMESDSDLLLSSLSRGVDRLAAFVNDLLDLGRVENGHVLEPRSVQRLVRAQPRAFPASEFQTPRPSKRP